MWTHSRSSGRRGAEGDQAEGAAGDAAGADAPAPADSGDRDGGSWFETGHRDNGAEPLPLRCNGNPAALPEVTGDGVNGQLSGVVGHGPAGRVGEAELGADSASGAHAGARHEVEPERALEPQPRNTTGLDSEALRQSLQLVEEHLDAIGTDFYSQFFILAPETRELFGAGMEVQRSRLLGAIVRIVGCADDREELEPYLEGLGRDHRKFGVIDQHYGPLGTALVLAIRRAVGERWTPRFEKAWIDAYDHIAQVMVGAARRDAVISPPWWDAEVVYHRRILDDLAIIQVRPHTEYPYRPGQYAYLTTPRRPKIWRAYSMASAPRDDGLLEFHVRTVGAGWVSSALVWRTEPGDVLHIGAPQGHDVATPRSEHDLLCITGGTGVAPVLATLQELEQRQDGRRVHVFYAGRDRDHLYALPHLESIGVRYRRLTVVPVVSPDGPTDRSPDLMGNIVSAYGDWRKHRVYVAGPTSMVYTSLERLREQGVPEEQIVVDDYGLW